MRVKNWDYRELRERIADGVTLRGCARLLGQPPRKAHMSVNPKYPTGEIKPRQAKAAFRRYVAEIGYLVQAWNELHHRGRVLVAHAHRRQRGLAIAASGILASSM
jgi:hypothetical protein